MKARIPADVEMPDQIFFGLTFRQIAIVAIHAFGIWGLFVLLKEHLQLWVIGLIWAPIVVVGLILVAARPAGVAPERFLLFAARHLLGPKRFSNEAAINRSTRDLTVRQDQRLCESNGSRLPRCRGEFEPGRSASGPAERGDMRRPKENDCGPGRSRNAGGDCRPRGPWRRRQKAHPAPVGRLPGTETAGGGFRLPVREVAANGEIDLGSDGLLAISRASCLNFALRSDAEKKLLTGGFARLLNSLDGPVQFLIHSEPADAQALIDALEDRAPRLPNPSLAAAAFSYADFLRSVTSQGDVLTSSVYVCLRERRRTAGSGRSLDRRVEEMSSLVRGLGVPLIRLDGREVRALIERTAEPSVTAAGAIADKGAPLEDLPERSQPKRRPDAHSGLSPMPAKLASSKAVSGNLASSRYIQPPRRVKGLPEAAGVSAVGKGRGQGGRGQGSQPAVGEALC